MSTAETALYIGNSDWTTRQIREASYDLVYSSREVLEGFVHTLQESDPDLRHPAGTRAVYEAFNVRRITSEKKFAWDRSERWVLKFFSDFSYRYTPANLDNRIFRTRETIQAFDRVQEALNYWKDELGHMDQKLTDLEEGRATTLGTVDSSYVDSRTLRFTAQGTHLIRPGAFTFVEN